MPLCVTCSREIPVGSAFCSWCGSPNPEGPSPALPADAVALRSRLQAALGADLTVEEELGEGGFAVVFAVFDRKLSRRIAVKVLRPELTSSPNAKQRFVREAESVARLNHPHILPIFFVGEGGALVYFGMPLVDGETLEQKMRREGALPPAEVVRIGVEVADALAEAHAAGLVHRDIKPANVMLQGSRARVLVTDFGIAKAAAGSGETLTGTGIAIGSPHYMSPEQASGDSHVDLRSDLYSLGILLWQMLAGALPFESDASQAVLMQQVTKAIPPIRSRRSDVSPALAAVIARLTQKDPADRYQSAEEVAHALRALAATPRGAPARPARRPLALFAAAAVVLAAGAGGAMLLRGRHAATGLAAGAADSVAAPARPGPVIAVLPFSVVTSGDTAQFSRAAALMFSEALALRNGVTTVDANNLLGKWIVERRRVTAPLDSSAGFAYTLGANQMVIGNYVESGRTFRLSAAMYDTHDAGMLWRDEVTGTTDSLFPLIDRLAARAAVALCGQPDYNPSRLCYDTPPRSRDSLAVTTADSQAPAEPLALLVRVSPEGTAADVRFRRTPAREQLAAQALAAVSTARFAPARKAGRPVEAWASVDVPVRQGGQVAMAAQAATRCTDPSVGVKNPDRACYDSRPVPQDRLPWIRTPASCAGGASPATVLVRVSAAGAVEGRPSATRPSSCTAFTDSALAAAAAIGFAPALKNGQPVAAWTLVLVRPMAVSQGGAE